MIRWIAEDLATLAALSLLVGLIAVTAIAFGG